MSRIEYFNLETPAPVRLAMMRADFAAHPAKYPHCPESSKPKTWRDVRGWKLNTWQGAFATLSQGFSGTGRARSPVWYAHTDTGHFRRVRDAHEVVRGTRHKGWFTDSHGSEIATGIIASISHGRFIAGYRWDSNGEHVYFPEVFTDETDAAQMADEHARIFADSARENSERFGAAQQIESDISDALQRLRECIALRHIKCMEYARSEARDLIESIREMRETLRTEYAGVY